LVVQRIIGLWWSIPWMGRSSDEVLQAGNQAFKIRQQ